MTQTRRTFFILAGAAGLAGCTGMASQRLTIADNNFVMQAAAGGVGEVAFGQMAQRKAANPQVRQFADEMVAEHTTANKELIAIAGKYGVIPPTSLDPGRVNADRQLSALTGNAFDLQYMSQQVQDHELQAALFRQQSTAGTNPELVAFAVKWLPPVERHLAMAKQIYASISTPAQPPQPGPRRIR